jgi:hypothetical protein
VDDLPNTFKATIAVFHGIIAVWLFSAFSETSINEFQFLILLVFFSVANLLVWNLLRLAWPESWQRGWVPFDDISAIRYKSIDVFGLTVTAVAIGLIAAWIQRTDTILNLANRIPFVDWQRTSTSDPFNVLILKITSRRLADIDRRHDALTAADAKQTPYIRIWLGDNKGGYEGHLSLAPTKSETREIILNPACRLNWDDAAPLKVKSTEIIEGFGVFLPLADVTAIEIIERGRSPCARLIDELYKRFEDNPQ